MDEPFAVAFVQDFIRDAGDLFEILAERLAAWLRAGAPPRALPSLVRDAGSIGDATAALHGALATLRGPSLAPRSGDETDLETWQHAADAARGKAMRLLGAVAPDQARWLARHATAIDDALSHLRPAGTLQRIHADLHLGQLLHSGDGLLIGDLEGEPTRPVSERRRLDTPLRDLASMLRSFDHVARSGMRRSGVPMGEIVDGSSAAEQAIDAWLASMRSAFLDAYAAEATARAGELSVTIDPRLLHALEVEKELYEFGYAATYLPTWMYAPSAGMRWLLDHSPA
jgi:predicted trehalose synthase